jgi:chemotaxis protein histidine kinase CheA
MDVVRTNIDQIGGTIDIKSVAGEGSRSPSRSR